MSYDSRDEMKAWIYEDLSEAEIEADGYDAGDTVIYYYKTTEDYNKILKHIEQKPLLKSRLVEKDRKTKKIRFDCVW